MQIAGDGNGNLEATFSGAITTTAGHVFTGSFQTVAGPEIPTSIFHDTADTLQLTLDDAEVPGSPWVITNITNVTAVDGSQLWPASGNLIGMGLDAAKALRTVAAAKRVPPSRLRRKDR